MKIGVILKTVEAYAAFLTFRKQWYVPTRFILDSRDIDESLELVISDVPLSITSPKLLIYGQDIHSFEELSNHVDVTRAIPFGAMHVVDTEKLKAVLPEVSIEDSFYDSLESEFTDLLYDSRDMEGLDIPTEGLSTEEVERVKAEKIAAILAQRAEEKRQKEEAARLEQERLAREEAERKAEEERIAAEKKAEQERLEAERKAEELRAAKEKAEREAAEAKHQMELDAIRIAAEQEQQRIALEAQRVAMATQEEQLKLQAERNLIEARQKAMASGQISLGTLSSLNVSAMLNQQLSQPMIVGYNVPQPTIGGGIRIGGRKTAKTSRVFVIAGAQKNCGSSTIAYNFAYSLAKANPNTLLIDLDFIDNDLSKWFQVDKLYDCSIDVPFRGIPFDQYMSNLENSVVKVSLGKRRLSFINCNDINNYTPENRAILRNYNYTDLLNALATRFDNIVVDIGCLSQVEPYQRTLLMSTQCKSVVCYGASSTADINESIQNVYTITGTYSAILAKAPRNINRIVIERTIRRPLLGVVLASSQYYAGCNLLYEDDPELQEQWLNLVRIEGAL